MYYKAYCKVKVSSFLGRCCWRRSNQNPYGEKILWRALSVLVTQMNSSTIIVLNQGWGTNIPFADFNLKFWVYLATTVILSHYLENHIERSLLLIHHWYLDAFFSAVAFNFICWPLSQKIGPLKKGLQGPLRPSSKGFWLKHCYNLSVMWIRSTSEQLNCLLIQMWLLNLFHTLNSSHILKLNQ